MRKHNILSSSLMLKRFSHGKLKYVVKHILYPGILNPGYFLKIYKNDFLTKMGYYKYPYNIIFIAGLPKSGTTLLENFVFNIPGYCPRSISGDPRIIVKQDIPENAFEHVPKSRYSFIKTHMNPKKENFEVLNKFGIKKIIVLYRDPRDIIISRYFHLLRRPKKPWEPHYIDYRIIDKNSAISHSIKVVISDYLPWIQGWLKKIVSNPKNHFVLTYEELISNPVEKFSQMLNFYCIDFDKSVVAELLAKAQKRKQKPFAFQGLHGKESTFRKGIVGDWRNHFTEKHKNQFKEAAGDFLIEIGYEEDLNW